MAMKILAALIVLICLSAKVFSQAGKLDSTFAGDGKVTTEIPYDALLNSMVIQPDGKIVAGGWVNTPGPPDFGWELVRYNLDGTLDNSFGYYGIVEQNFIGGTLFGSIAIQPDGKLLVTGFDPWNNGLERFNSNGSIDPSFFENPYDGSVAMNDVALQSDGKIIVVASSFLPDNLIAILRFNADGTPDFSFGNNGIITVPNINSDNEAIAIQPDDKIVVAANSALLRLTAGGVMDSSFNQIGLVYMSFASGNSTSNIGLEPDGKIIVVGGINNNDFAVARYNIDGSIDSSFGTDGVETTGIGFSAFATSVAIQSNGKIIVAGTSTEYQNNDFALAQYTSNGRLDSTFGEGGFLTTDFDNEEDYATSVGLEPDGKIVVAGTTFNNSMHKFVIARYLSDFNIGIPNFISSESSPLIYPNPVQSTEQFRYTLTKEETLTLSLNDMNGRVIKTFFTNQPRSTGNHTEQLDFSNIAAGSYLLTLSNGKQEESVKVVKQ